PVSHHVTHDAMDDQETQDHTSRCDWYQVVADHRRAWRRGNTSVSQPVFLQGWVEATRRHTLSMMTPTAAQSSADCPGRRHHRWLSGCGDRHAWDRWSGQDARPHA